MNNFIVLLRGINVSGQKKIPMAELRSLLESKGFKNVNTYIQSGNVILQSHLDKEAVEAHVTTAIKAYFGFDVPVLAITPVHFKQIFDACPFKQEEKENSYFMLLYDIPDKELCKKVSEEKYPNEKFVITGDCVYFYGRTYVLQVAIGGNDNRLQPILELRQVIE